MIHFEFMDQNLILFADRGVYWQERDTLIVADVHFGKAATFRAGGISLPAGTTQNNLNRLTNMLDITKADRLLILGDLLHAKRGRAAEMIEQVIHWRGQRPQLDIQLVLGNHDTRAGQPPAAWEISSFDELIEPPFVWRHHPGSSNDGYVVGGHIHPAVTLRGPGETLTLPCYYFGSHGAIWPAFGDFTGFARIRPQRNEPVFVIADDEVIQVG